MSTHEIADLAACLLTGLFCSCVGYQQGRRAGILRGAVLALVAIADWKKKYKYR